MAESYTPPGMSVAYTVPELSDPADAPQAFRDFADSISGVSDTVSVLPLAVNTTLSAGEEGYLLSVDTSGGDIEVTVPDNASVPLPVGYVVAIANLGGSTNVVKIKKGTGVNIQDQGFLQVEDYRISTLVKVSTDFWLVQAGSATYTPPSGPGDAVFDEGASSGFTFSDLVDPDGDGKNYRLASSSGTGSKTLAFSEGGKIRFLLASGAGSGGLNSTGYSGGGGSAVIDAELTIDAGSKSISIGAGGQAPPNTQNGNNGQNSTAFGITMPGGGGGTRTDNSVAGPRGGWYNTGGAANPVTSSITGSSVTYGNATGTGATGANGVLHVRVEV